MLPKGKKVVQKEVEMSCCRLFWGVPIDRSWGIKRASKIPHTVIVITPNGQSVGSNIVQSLSRLSTKSLVFRTRY